MARSSTRRATIGATTLIMAISARAVTSRGILNGFDGAFPDMRGFFYLPFQHSENLSDQERGLALYKAVGGGWDVARQTAAAAAAP